MAKSATHFSSRWGMFLAMLGMAVGTGNIWRFPRIAANNGGGSFLVAWVVFLLLWSVPLILVEFAIGKKTRYGTVGAFSRIMGKQNAWLGGWVAWVAMAIMFYYSVVAGWTIRYTIAAIAGQLHNGDAQAFWDGFAFTGQAPLFQLMALGLGIVVVMRGVRGIETATKILIPSLFLLVVALAIRALSLPGAGLGLNFLFTPEWSDLAHPRIWLEALTQNAWDTGAGWGLIVTYAIYMRRREDTALNSFMLGFGNNTVSLLAGIMVFCTVFSIMPDPELAREQLASSTNEGLTFIWVPQLFNLMPGGRFFMILFFTALFFAAWTSLISMIELATRVLVDGGMARKRAILTVGTVGFVLGTPSALSNDFFANQDFVWGVGLMFSGLFFALAVMRYGVRKFRERLINTEDSDIRIGVWWEWAIRFVVIEAIVLVAWWFWEVRGENIWGPFGIANMSLQFVVAALILFALNNWMVRRTKPDVEREEAPSGETLPSIP